MAVRLSQDLHLMIEPSSSLTTTEQEARRRLFWSVYMLDRFVSCSKQRPPAILDEDCQVQLPCDEIDFREGNHRETTFLVNMTTGNDDLTYKPDHFALVVLMACALGRCARYMLDNHNPNTDLAPWDPKSEFVAISSVLLYFESASEIGSQLSDGLGQDFLRSDGQVDQQKTGHLILSQLLFHLSHCLLNHPFLLRQRAEATKTKVPTTWMKRALRSGVEHARLLSTVFRDAKTAGCIVSTSFYGYCLLVAGTIHALYSHSEEPSMQQESVQYLINDLKSLDEISKYWNNTALIVSNVTVDCFSARSDHLFQPRLRVFDHSGLPAPNSVIL